MSEVIKTTIYRHWKKPNLIFAEVRDTLAFHKKGDPVVLTGKHAGRYVVQSVDEKLGKSFPKPRSPEAPPLTKEDLKKHNPNRQQHYIKEVLLAPEGQGLDVKKYYRRSDPITVEGIK